MLRWLFFGTVSYSYSMATMAVSLAVSAQYTDDTEGRPVTQSDRQIPHDRIDREIAEIIRQ